jgi:hypothetical protein
MAVNRTIFRQQALDNYQHVQLPKTLPRFNSPFSIFCYWMLFFILIGSIVGIWSWQLPMIQRGSGVIRHLTENELKTYGLPSHEQTNQAIAIVFFPEQAITTLRSGSSVSVLIAGSSQSIEGKIERVDINTLTAEKTRQRYNLGAAAPSKLSPVATIAFVRIDSTAATASKDGASATASYQTGKITVLELLFKAIVEKGVS